MFSIDFKVSLLKNFIRTAKSWNSDNINIRILRDVMCEDKIYVKFCFDSITGCGGSQIFVTNQTFDKIQTIGSFSHNMNIEEIYSGFFESTHLDNIIKSMEKDSLITLGMTNDNPLLIHYKHGLDDSFINMILSPSVIVN